MKEGDDPLFRSFGLKFEGDYRLGRWYSVSAVVDQETLRPVVLINLVDTEGNHSVIGISPDEADKMAGTLQAQAAEARALGLPDAGP